MRFKQILLAGAMLLLAIPAALAWDMDPGAGNNGVSNPGGGYNQGGGDGGGGWFENLSKGQMDQLKKDFKDKGKQSQQGNSGKSYNSQQADQEKNGGSNF